MVYYSERSNAHNRPAQGRGGAAALLRVSVVAEEQDQVRTLCSRLSDRELECTIETSGEVTGRGAHLRTPDVVLVVLDGSPDSPGSRYLALRDKGGKLPPVIALVAFEALDTVDPAAPVDDFVVAPWDAAEVALRIRRALRRVSGVGRGQSIVCGDLVIDLDNCEVTLQGKVVTLTFKEYELLKFLAGNKGRVFTREALLDEVWGHDYFGGDRTVDVHIRRLRSKTEAPTRTFIETVRNIGYRFRKDA
jgi:two-component system alkaline phosphatase synthesis response regulator PhoP